MNMADLVGSDAPNATGLGGATKDFVFVSG
jgi:hypothetical protein